MPDRTVAEIEAKHRKILAETLKPRHSILDAGCAWGRLLDLLPEWWDGRYLGVDLSPDFVKLAQKEHPTREFVVGNLAAIDLPDRFDLAVLISIRPMIRRNLGDEAWNVMEANLKRHAKKVLYLEYDAEDGGSLE